MKWWPFKKKAVFHASHYSVRQFMQKLDAQIPINQAEFDDWNTMSPMLAFYALCLKEIDDAWEHVMHARDWEGYVYWRGQYEMAVKLLELPRSITRVKHGGLDQDLARKQIKVLKEQLYGYPDRTDDAATGSTAA